MLWGVNSLPPESADPGNPRAQQLSATTYNELRGLARFQLARLRPGQTLQPTALVHEAWLRVNARHGGLNSTDDRRHFFFALGRAMRDLVVEDVRRRAAAMRSGRRETLTGLAIAGNSDDEVLAVQKGLNGLEQESPDHARVVVLRFFGGLTVEETATALGTSVSSVERRWRFCRAWLRKRIRGEPTTGRSST